MPEVSVQAITPVRPIDEEVPEKEGRKHVVWEGQLLARAAGRREVEPHHNGGDDARAEHERRSRERLEAAFTHAPIAMALVSLEGRLMYVNAALREMTGYGDAELTRKSLEELTHPDDLERARAEMRRLVRGEIQSYRREERHLRAEGEPAWVLVSGSLVRDERGAPDYLIVQLEDNSEHRRSEESLRRASRHFALSRDLVCTAGFDGVFREIGEAWTRVLGWSPEELRSRPFIEFVHPDDQAATRTEAEKLAGDGVTVMFTNRYRTKAGGWCWLEWSARAVMEEETIYAAARDVGERNAIEEELRAAHGALEAASEERAVILDSVAEGIFSVDPQGRVNFVNRAALELTGWSTEEMLGQVQHALIHHTRVDGTPYPREECPIYGVLQAGGVVRRDDEVFWRKTGESFPVEYVSAPLHEDGRIVGAVVAFQDITERKQAEREMAEARDQALGASRAKSAFLANMSHEIRTPMNGVIGMTELLLDTELGEEQRDYAKIALSSADALLSVIDDILDFSKIEAGKLRLDSHEFEPRETVADVCKMLAGEAHGKGLELACTVHEEVPTTLWGDQGRLRQVLTNLLANAIKFTSAGEVAVQVAVDRPAEGGVLLRGEVIDTGIGVKGSEIADLFDPFHQADVSTTRKYGGTGLGLAISKQLVELMGGEMGATSEPGVGSTFWFTVRCAADREEAAADRDRSQDETEQRTSDRHHAAADREGAAVDREEAAADRDRSHEEADQRTSDRHHAAADREGAAVDREAAAAARDQTQAEADQRTSDRGHAAADREAAAADREASAAERGQSQGEADRRTSNRDHAAAVREAAAAARDQTQAEADQQTSNRDHAAANREGAAVDREEAAAARDQTQAEADQRTSDRDHAAADRADAAVDREEAAAERAAATHDREQARAELRHAQLDQLTGAFGRELGMVSLEHEIKRARHGSGRLVLACVDVDGLKQINDRQGHPAGDALLRAVVGAIQTHLHSYDPVVRIGGNQFVCATGDKTPAEARLRFQEIRAKIERTHPCARISVGFAALRPEDTLEQLLKRGDSALYEIKHTTR